MNDIDHVKKLKDELEAVKAELPNMMMLYETIVSNNIDIDDIIKAVVLTANIKKLSKFGKVSIILRDGHVVLVQQEQQFILSQKGSELNRPSK